MEQVNRWPELDSPLKKWLFRIGFIVPFAFGFFLYFYCTSYELTCKTEHEKTEERKTKTSDSDNLPIPLGIESKIYESETGDEANNRESCSFPCDVFKRAREDAVAFFTAVLACIVWLQLLFMIRQEDWLRRSWKVGAAANSIALRSEERTVETSRTIERAYVQLSHVTNEINPGLFVDWRSGESSVNIGIKNHGNTPARVTRVFLTKRMMATALPRIPEYAPGPGELTEQPMEAFLMKGAEIFMGFNFTIDVSDIPLIKDRKKQLVIYGFVEYMDQFDRKFRGGYARNFVPDLAPNNLIFAPQPGYNYDEERA